MADNRRQRRRGRPRGERVPPRVHPYVPILPVPQVGGVAATPERVPTRNFFVTFSQFNGSREDVVVVLRELNCSRYVVALENHHDAEGRVTGCHIHAFFKTEVPILLTDLRHHLCASLGENFVNRLNPAINLQPITEADVRSKVEYATKEDLSAVIVGVPLSYASLYFRQYVYIKTHRVFCYNDPLVFECKHELPYLLKRHSEFWEKQDFAKVEDEQRIANQEFTRKHAINGGTWVDDLNTWIQAASFMLSQEHHLQTAPTTYKQRNLYLWGDSGVGKTTTLEMLLPSLANVCFTPTSNEATFAYSGLNSATRAIYIPDADKIFFANHRETVLRLAEGKVLSIASKFSGPLKMAFHGLFVVVSNYQPPVDPAFVNRFTIIHACRVWSACVTER